MKFYTSVAKKGDNILYRGYENGERVQDSIQFKPTLFLDSKKNSKWKSLQGENLDPLQFDSISEASGFLKQYEHVHNFNVHGMSNYVSQFIYEQFPTDINFDRSIVNIMSIDIEVESENGFPHPREANNEVISICCKSNLSPVFYVWALGDYDTTKSIVGEDKVRYIKCAGEADLLLKFLNFWMQDSVCPDVVTGWNSNGFDIPYLVNRIKQVLPGDSFKKLSPWRVIRERNFRSKIGKEEQVYDLMGIQSLDYLDLFRKFSYTYGTQESYKLDHIAYVVLGEKKISYSEHGSLHSLYKNDHQKFIDYNIRDVQLIEQFEEKLEYITLAMTMAYKAGANYTESLGTTGLWDSYIYRSLSKKNIVVPSKVVSDKDEFPGGYVKPPMIGRHSWVVSFDLNSLYPHLIMGYNMSPETVMSKPTYGVTVNNCLDKTKPDSVLLDCAVAANGVQFRKDIRGVIPSVIDSLYTERKTIKGEMISLQKQEQRESSKEASKKIASLDTRQMAIKIMMNSLFGAIGNRYFRYYDIRIAEAITLSGQLSILWAEKTVNKYMNAVLKTDAVDYVIAIDTDSLYVNFGPLVKMLNLDETDKNSVVEVIDKICNERFLPQITDSYEELAAYMNAYENKMFMGREAIADAGIWTAKKRYILNVYNNEGVQYKTPKLKIMGIEAVKSSTPSSCREALKELFKIIIVGTEQQTREAIDMFKQHFKTLPPQDIAFPRGVSRVVEYRGNNSVYKKGTPIHVRGSLLYNDQIDKLGLTNYEKITDGDKVKFMYLKLPNPIRENVVAFQNFLPEEMNLHKYIDHDTQFDKAFLAVVRPIMDAIGWSEEDSVSLDEFFG